MGRLNKNNDVYVPFSNGTEAMVWYGENCQECTKAYFPKDGIYPSDKTMKNYCSIGKECKLKYAIDLGFITGEIPDKVACQIGKSEFGLKDQCLMFSDNSDDGWKPPKRPKPDKTPDKQILLFSEFDDLFSVNKIEELDKPKVENKQLEYEGISA